MRIFETEDSNRQYITYGIFKHYEKKPSGNSEIGLPLVVQSNKSVRIRENYKPKENLTAGSHSGKKSKRIIAVHFGGRPI